MPKMNVFGTWPSSGEIDLVESRGNRNLYNPDNVNVGVGEVSSVLHFGPAWNLDAFPTAFFPKHSDAGFNEDFHVYRLGWTSESIEFSVDNQIIGSVNVTAEGGFWERGGFDEREPGRDNPWKRHGKIAPFDQEFYVIMNLAVGGVNGFFSDANRNEGSSKPWSNGSPQAFLDFWNGRSGWLPTWNMDVDDSSHLQVDYVRIYAV
jgi:beta-glucanase (GH16 family)